jgi:hypothetical protein
MRVPGLIARPPKEAAGRGAMIPDQREWQRLNENNEPSGASQNILDFAARLSVSWTRGPRRVRPGRRPREAPLMHVAKEDLRAPPVYSPSALGKRAHGGVARRRLAIRPSWLRKLASTSTAFQRAPRSSARRVIRQTRTARGTQGAGSRRAARNPALISATPLSFLRGLCRYFFAPFFGGGHGSW